MKPEEKAQAYKVAKQLLSEQNFQVAVISGIIATILAAGIYAVIAVVAGYAVSFMAIGVGVLVGITIQYLGRGIESKFTVLASVLAVVGCVLGNVFAALILTARAARASASDVLSEITFGSLVDYAVSTFQLIDIVYWALAVWAASYFARRPLTREQGLAVYTYENSPPDDQAIIS